MNTFQICQNTADLTPLYLPQQLYLKPIARINISLQLPNIKKIGKSVSHWEIMDQIRALIRPDEFTTLKVSKTTVEFVRLEGELDCKDKVERIVFKIHNKMIKLKDFGELMRLKAAEWKSDFPTRRIWDDFFQNAHDMDEMKPGQRPDTVHISYLPSKWFVPYHLSGEEDIVPSEKIFYRIFEKFGQIRFVDIPICDPYRKKMNDNISGLKNSSFDNTQFFEGYVQYKDYIGFTKAMDTFKNMKLVHKEDDSAVEVNIKVDFDKNKHLSDASIRRREIVRDRLVRKAREQEEKDKIKLEEKKKKEEIERQKEVDLKEQKKLRRKLREEKRKAKILKKLEISGSDEINEKIAQEEKKLLNVQRKLEAIRLVEELFRRIQDKNPRDVQCYKHLSNPSLDELTRFKNSSELEVLDQKEKLHDALRGRAMLKTILASGRKAKRFSSPSSDSDISLELEKLTSKQKPISPVFHKYPELMYEQGWVGYPPYIPQGPMFHDTFAMGGLISRGRSFPRMPNIPGPSRGGYGRRRAGYRYRGGNRGGGTFRNYPQDLEEEFFKFLNEHDVRKRRSYSPKRSRKRSRSRSRSRRSYSRSRSRSKRRSRSRRSRSYSYRSRSRSYTRSRSRSKYRRSRTRSRSRGRSRSRSRTATRENTSATNSNKRTSKSREKSVDSSSFMTPKQLQQQKKERSKSRSWSKESNGKGRSWSKSPGKIG